MTTTTHAHVRRPAVRRAAFVVLAAAGVTLSPLPASRTRVRPQRRWRPPRPPRPPTRRRSRSTPRWPSRASPTSGARAGPNSFDCSGLIAVRLRGGRHLRCRTRRACSRRSGTPVARPSCSPVTWSSSTAPVSHVGIYIGNGQMVHASTAGQPVKVVEPRLHAGLQLGPPTGLRCSRRSPAGSGRGRGPGSGAPAQEGGDVLDRLAVEDLVGAAGDVAEVRGQDGARQRPDRVVGRQRFLVVDVEAGAGDAAARAARRPGPASATIGPRLVLMKIGGRASSRRSRRRR